MALQVIITNVCIKSSCLDHTALPGAVHYIKLQYGRTCVYCKYIQDDRSGSSDHEKVLTYHNIVLCDMWVHGTLKLWEYINVMYSHRHKFCLMCLSSSCKNKG